MSDDASNNGTAADLALQQLCPHLNDGKMLDGMELDTLNGAFKKVDSAWRSFGGLRRLTT